MVNFASDRYIDAKVTHKVRYNIGEISVIKVVGGRTKDNLYNKVHPPMIHKGYG